MSRIVVLELIFTKVNTDSKRTQTNATGIRVIELPNYPSGGFHCIQMVTNLIVQRRRDTSVPLSKWLGVGQFNGMFYNPKSNA